MKHTKIFWFSDISCETFMSAKPLHNRFYEIHICQQDVLSLSQTCYVFESDLPYFVSDIPCIESDLPVFRTSPSHFSNESFSIFQISPSNFFKPDLPIFFWVIHSHFSKAFLLIFESNFFGFSPPNFLSQIFPFWTQIFPFFRVSPSHFSESDLVIFWVRTFHLLGQSFPVFWVRPFHFIQETFI